MKDAMNEALRDWVTNVENTYYLIGTVAVLTHIRKWSELSARYGEEVKGQLKDLEGSVDCQIHWSLLWVGGSNAMGLFYPFLDE
ncbi:MAG: hypothetical protein CM1200mP4_4930 [Rhodospirillaceae bacterium]|nr:MAG: hypothetical protein CM1200mP4_4930 [Rhodospirillaceae bacterium]